MRTRDWWKCNTRTDAKHHTHNLSHSAQLSLPHQRVQLEAVRFINSHRENRENIWPPVETSYNTQSGDHSMMQLLTVIKFSSRLNPFIYQTSVHFLQIKSINCRCRSVLFHDYSATFSDSACGVNQNEWLELRYISLTHCSRYCCSCGHHA